MKVAIQGQDYSFHDVAQKQYFGGEPTELIKCETFKEVFEALDRGEADYLVCAMENSLYGSINEVYDLVLKHNIWIMGEIYLHIKHCLIGLLGAKIENIKEVHSHPVALGQCLEFLDTNLHNAERFEHHDTAGSAADIKRWNDVTKAAIASEESAKAYGLEIIESEVETNKHNYTRFVVATREKPDSVDVCEKTSLILTTGHSPGALYKALGAFYENDINLTKLESRPIVGTKWEYMFYVDIESGLQEKRTQLALDIIKSHGQQIRVIGSYKKDSLPNVS